MFISKKKFNEAIENAKREECERMWERERFNRLEEHLNRRIGDLEKRLWNLEHPDSAPSDNLSNEHTGTICAAPIGY